MAGQHGGVADVLGDHRFAQTVAADQDQVAGFGEEVQREGAFDNVAFDLGGPGPIEVGHGLELLDADDAQAALQAAVRALGGFGLRQLFQHLARGPARFGGARQKVVQLRGHGAQADLLQLRGQVIVRRRRLCGVGEFIVGLQIMRANVERLSLRMPAEIERQRRGARCRRSRKATEEARGVLRSRASPTARRKAAAPY